MHALLADPVVQRRIREDPELRRGADHAEAMAKLLELVRGLTADPAVQARIRADPALRALWSEPAVRRTIGAGAP
jgi:hypothetical protein